MANPFLYLAGEDIDISNTLTTFGSAGVAISTTANDFRAGYARYAFDCLALQSFAHYPFLDSANLPTAAFSASSFWTSGRFVCRSSSGATANAYGGYWLKWLDASGNVRLQIRNLFSVTSGTSQALPPTSVVVEKVGVPVLLSSASGGINTNTISFASVPASIVLGMIVRNLNSSGIPEGVTVVGKTATTVTLSAVLTAPASVGNTIQFQSIIQLGPTITSVGLLGQTPLKVDVYINYNTAGQFTLYQGEGGQRQLFSFFGDVTMDGATLLSSVQYGQLAAQYLGTIHNLWSEMMVSAADTRMLSLWTRAPVAAGNADTFTNGDASNVNGNTANLTTFDYSLVAMQMQEYTATGAPAGTFTVQTVQETGLVAAGTSGPSHLQYLIRLGGVDYPSATLGPSTVWSRIAAFRDTNPATGSPWTVADLISAGFNLGYESLA